MNDSDISVFRAEVCTADVCLVRGILRRKYFVCAQAIIKANYVCKSFFPGGRLRCFMTCKSHKGHRWVFIATRVQPYSSPSAHHHPLQNRFSPPRGSNLKPFAARWRKEREEQSCPALDVTLLPLKGWRKIWHGNFLHPVIVDWSRHFAWLSQPACLSGCPCSKRFGTLIATRHDLATLW